MFALMVFSVGVLSLTRGLEVDIDLNQVHAEVEPEFLSVTIDSGILSPPKWNTFSFT